jgi:proteasome beta subunit
VDTEGSVRLTEAEVAAVADTIVTERAEADRQNMPREA